MNSFIKEMVTDKKHFIGLALNFGMTFFSLSCFPQSPKYNSTSQIASHNTYEPENGRIADVLQYTKSIEIDIWDSRLFSGGWKAMTQDWYVRHNGWDEANQNCCGGPFSDCLRRLKEWSDLHPLHEVITVFLDKKENWSDNTDTRKPDNLDQLLIAIFSKEKIFSPASLTSRFGTLREATRKDGWPVLDSLKSKFIFVITNGVELTYRNPLNEYLSAQKDNAVCFVAPTISGASQIIQPDGISNENTSNIVFYNIDFSNRNISGQINSSNYITRVFGLPLPETKDLFQELVNSKVNFIVVHDYKLGIL